METNSPTVMNNLYHGMKVSRGVPETTQWNYFSQVDLYTGLTVANGDAIVIQTPGMIRKSKMNTNRRDLVISCTQKFTSSFYSDCRHITSGYLSNDDDDDCSISAIIHAILQRCRHATPAM